ncbi:MAG: HlyD family secretion protein [Rhodospirillaceae bacterium]|nr:HlyD family secretion protein [Rhodospirillaceae bacterium]
MSADSSPGSGPRTTNPAPPISAPSARRRPFARLVILAVVAGGIFLWAANWARTTLLYVHETDARIVADMITVASRVDGLILSRPIEEGDRVTSGQIIAVVDANLARLKLAELEAEMVSADTALDRIDSEIALADRATATRVASSESRLAEARAGREATGQEFRFAESEFQRSQALQGGAAITASRVDRTRADYLKQQQEMARSSAQVKTAEGQLAEARAERQRIEVLKSERATLVAKRQEILARIDSQKAEIDRRQVVSPIDGVVSRTFVGAGEYASAGQRVALMHDPQKIWIEARFRETDIRRLSVGQVVHVTVDAYPDDKFDGKIERIGHAATSEFALLPTPNPTGNFTKVTQRLPVRIAIQQRDGRLRPGMMVEVYVDLR